MAQSISTPADSERMLTTEQQALLDKAAEAIRTQHLFCGYPGQYNPKGPSRSDYAYAIVVLKAVGLLPHEPRDDYMPG